MFYFDFEREREKVEKAIHVKIEFSGVCQCVQPYTVVGSQCTIRQVYAEPGYGPVGAIFGP